jgi:type I restriction enzyme, R subunit
MSSVGQREKRTQQRVVKLFCEQLGYDYLGDWTDRAGNRNIEEQYLRPFLHDRQGYDDALISRALYLLDKTAGDTSKSLYDRNKAVYGLLRYGLQVKAEVGDNAQTVWLIDWKKRRRTTLPLPRKSPLPLQMPRRMASVPMWCCM